MEEIVIPLKYEEFNLEISAYIHKNSDNWILCLHGLQSNKEIFKNLLPDSLFDDYSLLIIDFIGFGKSSKPEKFSYDLMEQTSIVQEIIRYLDMKKINLIGHSMGGMVGTLLLDAIPEKIISIINMEGNLILEDCGTSKDIKDFNFEEFHSTEFQKIKDNMKKSSEPSAKYREKWLNQIPDYAFYKSSLSIFNWSKSKKLLQIFMNSKHKKLYMFGDKNIQKTNSLNNKIQLAKISNAGHFMLIDNAKECTEQIEQFLQ
jgi:pimeloyl-ACP methyl ester carboxylesterase